MRGIEALSVSHTVKFPRGRKRRRWPAHPSAYLNPPTTSSHGFLPHASLGFQTFPNTILLKNRAPKREAPDLYKRLSECGNLTNTEPTCRALRKQRRQNSPAAGGGARGSPTAEAEGAKLPPRLVPHTEVAARKEPCDGLPETPRRLSSQKPRRFRQNQKAAAQNLNTIESGFEK